MTWQRKILAELSAAELWLRRWLPLPTPELEKLCNQCLRYVRLCRESVVEKDQPAALRRVLKLRKAMEALYVRIIAHRRGLT